MPPLHPPHTMPPIPPPLPPLPPLSHPHPTAHPPPTHHSSQPTHATHHPHATHAGPRGDDRNHQISHGVNPRRQFLSRFGRRRDLHHFVFDHIRELHRLQEQLQHAPQRHARQFERDRLIQRHPLVGQRRLVQPDVDVVLFL